MAAVLDAPPATVIAPVTQVTYELLLDSGEPDTKGKVRAVLNQYDIDAEYGYVEPKVVVSTPDSDGKGSLFLWSNERGSTGSVYNVSVDGTERSLSLTAVIPLAGPISLTLCSTLPPYPPRSSIIEAVAATAKYAGEASASAVEAKTSETNAAASAATAQAAQAGVDASAAAAAASATAAEQAATTAATDAVAQVQVEISDDVAAAQAAATAAEQAATNAVAQVQAELNDEVTAAAGSATAAHTSEVNAKLSEDNSKASELASAQSVIAADGSEAAALISEQHAQASRDAAAASAAATSSSVAAAHDSEVAAAQSATEAASSAIQADESEAVTSGYADTVTNALGQMTLATAIMLGYLNDATGAVSLAQAYAAQALSVVQQDLSGAVNVPLYRSPNPVLGTFTQDITRDKDGGAWIDAAIAQSWVNEPSNGRWLPHPDSAGWQSELHARMYGATLGAELFLGAWTTLGAGTTYANGVLTVPSYPVSGTVIASHNTLLNTNKSYWITYTIISIVGSVSTLGGVSSGPIRTSPGTYTEVLSTAVGTLFGFQSRNAGVTSALITGISVKEITAVNTKTGDYYQLATDGKYYRQWKNLLKASNLKSDASWTKGTAGMTVTENAIVGVDGVSFTADKVTESVTNGNQAITQFIIPIPGVPYLLTTDVKAGERGFALVGLSGGGSGGGFVSVNLATGAFFTASGAVTSSSVTAVGNGFWRVSVDMLPTTNSSIVADIRVSIDGVWNNRTYAGVVGNGIYVDQTQIQIGTVFDGYEDKSTTDATVTETFRGNKRAYPRMPQVVWEAANTTIMDLGEPGRPMWMRFTTPSVSAGAATSGAITASVAGSITSVVLGNGKMLVSRSGDTSNVHGMNEIDFIRDSSNWYAKYTGASFGVLVGGGTGCRIRGTIAERNVLKPTQPDAAFAIGSGGGVNGVAMTVLPDAPIDPITGLPVPAIGLALGNGGAGVLGSIIMNDGGIVTYSQVSNDGSGVAFTQRGDVVWGLNSATTVFVLPLSTTNVANVGAVARQYGTTTSPNGGPGVAKKFATGGGLIRAFGLSWNYLTQILENTTTPGASLVAQQSGAHSAGVMVGDVRRMELSGIVAGAAVGVPVVLGAMGTPAGFDSITSNVSSTGFTETKGTTQVRGYVNLPATVPGSTYSYTFTYANSVLGNIGIANQPNGGGTLVTLVQNVTNGTFTYTFTAPAANCSLVFFDSGTFTVSNLTVQFAAFDYSYKAKPAAIFGSLTLSPVATAAQLVGWGGFKNDNSTAVPSLIINGTFDSGGLTPWTTTTPGSTIANTFNNAAQLTGDNTNSASMSQSFATVIGRQYVAAFAPDNVAIAVSAGTAILGTDNMLLSKVNPSAGAIVSAFFTATANATWLNFSNKSNIGASIDNITVREASPFANVVYNGVFATDLSGWDTAGTGGTSTVTWVGGAASFTGDGTNAARLSQQLSTVAGRSYKLVFDVGAQTISYSVGTTQNGGQIIVPTTQAPGLGTSVSFVATGGITWIGFSKTAAITGTLDNVSVTGTNAVGASVNAVQEPSSTDLDTGTGARRNSAWVNVPATVFGPSNFVRNNSFIGSTTGPDASISADANGVAITIAGYGTESGIRFVDVHIEGTPTASSSHFVSFSGAGSRIPTGTGNIFTGSEYASLISGQITNLQVQLEVCEYDSTGTPLSATATTMPLVGGAGFVLAQNRYSATRTTSVVNVNSVALRALRFNYTTGNAIYATVRLGLPQLERGAVAGSAIITPAAATFVGLAPIYYRGGASGPYSMAGIDGNGMFAAEMYDGTTTRRATSNVAMNNGVWRKVVEEYDGAGTISLRMDAVPVGSATGTALLTMNNAAAPMTYGNNYAFNAAFPGQIALVHIGVTTLPNLAAEQWAYEAERAMFKQAAQVSLPDLNVVLSASYDDKLGATRVTTSANEALFTGLVRTSVAAVTTGTITNASQQMGIRALVRNGGAVDITIPAQDLKAELARRAEDAARVERGVPRVFNFDATASQTDFPLPAGWEAIGVSAARFVQREGATKDYIRKFDGFRETVSFITGQAAATWVQVSARRAA